MQPYASGKPIGMPEMVPEQAADFERRVNELMEWGADEVRVFKATSAKLDTKLKKQGLNRAQRREWLKRHRGNTPTEEN